MRTTIRLNEGLLRRVKRNALERHKTFTAVVADALSAWVQKPVHAGSKKFRVRPPTGGSGGLLPGVDLDSNRSLSDRMDGLT